MKIFKNCKRFKNPPEWLLGEVKALILMYEEDGFYTDLIVCGANCESLILDMAQQKDISCLKITRDEYIENYGNIEGTGEMQESLEN